MAPGLAETPKCLLTKGSAEDAMHKLAQYHTAKDASQKLAGGGLKSNGGSGDDDDDDTIASPSLSSHAPEAVAAPAADGGHESVARKRRGVGYRVPPHPTMGSVGGTIRTCRVRCGSSSTSGGRRRCSSVSSHMRDFFDFGDDNDSDDDDEYEDFEECEPAYIHWIRNGDSLAGLTKIYRIPVDVICKANDLVDVNSSLETKRFLVIPSATTFLEPIWDVYQEQHELCKNFLLLVRQYDYGLAHTYLGRTNYNLSRSIENYFYDLC